MIAFFIQDFIHNVLSYYCLCFCNSISLTSLSTSVTVPTVSPPWWKSLHLTRSLSATTVKTVNKSQHTRD